MSITPSDDYITATKLIESFGCFFEKINNVSSGDIPHNSQKLADLKKLLYSNLHSPEAILSATEELYDNNNQDDRLLSPTKTLVTVRSLEQSQRLETTPDYSVPRNFFSVQPSEISHLANQEGGYEEKSQLSTEYLPATSFLALVKAACHNDMSKLFSLSSRYAYIRTFTDQQQSMFTALCFAFFEKLIREKGRDSQFYLTQGHHQKKTRADPVIAQEAEFLHFFKTFCQNAHEGNMKKLYEAISNNGGFYTSALSIFKQHITRVVLDRLSIPINQSESFEWMNDLDEVEDTSFFQSLTKVFKCNLKFLILTRVRLIERMFYCDNCLAQNDLTLTIFFDKTSRMSFILYPKDDSNTEEESESTYQRVKNKPSINIVPSLNNGSLKSLKNIGVDYYNGSLTTLDTLNPASINSLNEIEQKDKHKNIAPAKHLQLKKANTLNVFTANAGFNDNSPCFTYPESALIRPSTEKVNYTGFSSASKDLEYYRVRTEEDPLVRKDREPAPTRPGNFFDYNDIPEEKQFGQVASRLDFSKQYLTTMPDEPRLSSEAPERSTYIDRSPQRESISLRAYMSETKNRSGDYLFNRACSIDTFSTRVKGHKEMVAMSIRPVALPILLKSKFDRFNHILNQNDQEIANTVARHVNNESNMKEYKGNADLGNLMNTYQMIMGTQSQETSWCRPSIVTMLRMDR